MPWGRCFGSLILPWHQSAGSRVIREAQREPSSELRVLSLGFPSPSAPSTHAWPLTVTARLTWCERGQAAFPKGQG